jgi:hypothetical protein
MAEVTGGDRLDAALREMAKRIESAATVRVGFLEDATYPDGTKVATIAALNNFGAPAAGIPPRPFFSSMIAAKSPGWGDKFAAVLTASDYDAHKSLELMGEGIAGQLREAIVDMTGPANSPVTDLLKERFPMGGQTFDDVMQARRDVAAGETAAPGKPLVWTGHLLNSVGSEVE